MVQRMTSVLNWATWLNTVTGDLFWSVCGVLCLWVVLFMYLKQRFGVGTAFVGSSFGIVFVAALFYFVNLVSSTLAFVAVAAVAISMVVLWVGG